MPIERDAKDEQEAALWKPLPEDSTGLFQLQSMRVYRATLIVDELEPEELRIIGALAMGGWGPVSVWRPLSAPKNWPRSYKPSVYKEPKNGIAASSVTVWRMEGLWVGKDTKLAYGKSWEMPHKDGFSNPTSVQLYELWAKDPSLLEVGPEPEKKPAPAPDPPGPPARRAPEPVAQQSSATPWVLLAGAGLLGLVLVMRAGK